MRPGSWLLLLSLLLSAPAAAQEPSTALPSRRRTLVLPARPELAPPLEVQVAGQVATVLRFDTPLRPVTLTLPANETRLRLLPAEDGTVVILPSSDLLPNEQVPLIVESGADAGPLRFSLVTRREVDLWVQLSRAPASAEEDAAELMARSLLDQAQGRPALVVPQRRVARQRGMGRLQFDSVLWMGHRLFVTLAVTQSIRDAQPWRLVQVRLRSTLPDGALREWSARLLTGTSRERRQYHIFTSLLPTGAERLEMALDGEDSIGAFHPLPSEEGSVHP